MHGRVVAKQRHTRFDAEKCVAVLHGEAFSDLVRASVKESTNAEYDSRLRTLEKFLRSYRNSEFADAATCSHKEWIQFLVNWRMQGMGPANGTHSALLQLHRRLQLLPSFLDGKLAWKLTKGAGSAHTKVDKGCLSKEMQTELLQFMESECVSLSDTCACCEREPQVRQRIKLGAALMLLLNIRPGNLKDFQIHDFTFPNGAEVGSVFVKNWKTTNDGATFPLTLKVLELALQAFELSGNDYLFPRCIARHLTDCLREAESVFGWPEGLVYTVHCLRHSGMENANDFVKEAVAAVKKAVTRVTGSTFDGYTKPIAKRSRQAD